MFQVNRAENRLRKLEERRFSDLKLREREHLQEWLANMPTALGEELLIIQKEFDGFTDTRERLDLLALDKDGRLVVIENKLDDSGRDVTWQALKYSAYCSSLTKAQIIDIFQQYLDRYCGGGNATAQICEFLEVEELDEVVLNPGNDQRLMFIAAKFRKEVTATVLWLLGHGISAQCFKVVPYTFGEELFIDLQQIIPTPEAAEFMIGISTKEIEEKTAKVAQKGRYKLRLEFWEQTLESFRAKGVTLFQNVSPSKDYWINAGSGVGSCRFQLIFSRDEARVELSMQRSEAKENKWLFDQLWAQKDELEAKFGGELDWRRMDDKKASRIAFSHPFDGFNKESWPEMIDWLAGHIVKLETAFSAPLAQLNESLKSGGGVS